MAPAAGTATPTVATSTPTAINPQGQNFSGDEFSNNLFSDLAPLMTLFGEQVTKQFLTMSMGWSDNVLLAMGPLGILTIVVSAIRVGGVKRLKALVGRARESKATAEQELLSSTSDSVCELWSGKEIVRQLGQPKMKEMVLFWNSRLSPEVYDLGRAFRKNLVYDPNYPAGVSREEALADVDKLSSQAPNIALNVEGSTSSKAELWIWVIVGVLLQSVALVFPALATYVWRFPKTSSHVQGYAYPSFLIGTLAVILGTILCSHVIEGVTVERSFVARRASHVPTRVQVLRLQKACRVSDQTFTPYLILNAPGNEVIRTSRLQVTDDSFVSKLAGAASLLTMAGYICQFVGLRGLHWSATVVQLGITLFMTGVRSWVRRGLASEPPHIALNSGHEMEEAAIYLALFDPRHNRQKSPFKPTSGLINGYGWWEIVTGGYRKSPQDPSPLPRCVRPSREDEGRSLRSLGGKHHFYRDPVVSIRRELQPYMPDDSPIHEMASVLERTMEKIMIAFDEAIIEHALIPTRTSRAYRNFEWSHLVSRPTNSRLSTPELFKIPLSCASDIGPSSMQPIEGRRGTPAELYSILSLWIYSLDTRNVAETLFHVDVLGNKKRPQHASAFMRVIGRCDDFDTGNLRAIPAWIGRWILLCPEPDGQSTFSNRVHCEAPIWPVFGYESLFHHRGMSHRSHLYDDLKGALFLPDWTDRTMKMKSEPGLELREDCIAILSHHNMATQCALEMLSGLMNAVASEVQSLGGRTEFETASNGLLAEGYDVFKFANRMCLNEAMPDETYYEYDGDRWTNSVLLSFSRILVDTGLVRSLEEANAIVIPPFAKRGLLPTEEGNVRFDPSPTESRMISENPIEETSSISSDQGGPPGGSKGMETSLSSQENAKNGEKNNATLEPGVVVTELVG